MVSKYARPLKLADRGTQAKSKTGITCKQCKKEFFTVRWEGRYWLCAKCFLKDEMTRGRLPRRRIR